MSAATGDGVLGRRALIEGALASLLLPWLAAACGDDGSAAEPGDGGALDDIVLRGDGGTPATLPAGAREYFSDAERAAIAAIGEARAAELEGDGMVLRETLEAAETLSTGELRERVADDFAAARTVLVAGWVLSRTEADLCALFALLEME